MLYTVMVKNIGTPALLSDNAPLLPDNCCSYKWFGIIALEKHKKSQKKSQIWYNSTQNSKNGLDRIFGTFSKL